VAANLVEEADLIFGQPRQAACVSIGGIVSKELTNGEIQSVSNLGQRVQRGDGVAVFNPRKIAAQKTCTLLDVALRHSFLQSVCPDGRANIHSEASTRGNFI